MLKKIFAILMCVALMAALLLPVTAAEFTPSVSGKDAPDIVPVVGPDGREYAGVIYDEDGNIIAYVPASQIIITPISAAGSALDEIRERLEAAYGELTNTDDLSKLYSGLSDLLDDVDIADLVVRDLFDVHVTGEYADYLAQDGNTLTITFNLESDSALLAAVLQYLGENGWTGIMGTSIVRNGRYVTITIDHPGTLAFLFDNGKLDVDPNGPTSPETGLSADFTTAYLTVAALAAALCAAVVLLRKKVAA